MLQPQSLIDRWTQENNELANKCEVGVSSFEAAPTFVLPLIKV